LIVFSLRRESLKLILATDPFRGGSVTPTIEAPNTAAPKGPYTPCQRDDTNAHRRPKHSTKERHHHRRRLTSHLHREGCQIYLLNNQKNACPKEERDLTSTKPVAKMTTSLRIQQPPT
jgi:hypothetical protein